MAKYNLRDRQDNGTENSRSIHVHNITPRNQDTGLAPEAEEASAGSRGQGLTSTTMSTTDWLYNPTAVARGWQRYQAENLNRDGFLALSTAIQEHGDSTQELMFIKFYRFMRGFLPGGLVGEAFGHIRANDVMRHLLSHHGETTPSRHKFAKDATAAFRKLEAWMAKGTDWQEARDRAADADDKTKKASGKKKPAGLAPGLYSSEGILALLIIAQADEEKFKNWIVRGLQIDWMLTQDRATLDVQHGFWEGITAENLHRVFAPQDGRTAEVELLADYTQLFGAAFVQARNDIRPFLPDWAQDRIHLEEDINQADARSGSHDSRETSGQARVNGATRLNARLRGGVQRGTGVSATSESGDDTDAAASNIVTKPAVPQEDVLALRHCLTVDALVQAPEAQQDSEHWLLGRLSHTPSGPLQTWGQHWIRRMENAKNYQEQVIIQSLFLQSVQRLRKLSTARLSCIQPSMAAQNTATETPLEDIYAAVDVFDGSRAPALSKSSTQQFLSYMRALPVCSLDDANDRLDRLIKGVPYSQTVADLHRRLSDAELAALCEISTSDIFGDHLFGILAFHTLRTHVLIDGLQDGLGEKASFWRSQRDTLLNPHVVATLMLTDWQLWSLLLPGADSESVLTPWQQLIFRSAFCQGTQWKHGMGVVRLDQFERRPLVCPARLAAKIGANSKIRELFSEIQRPESLPFEPEMLDEKSVSLTSASPTAVPTGRSIPSEARSDGSAASKSTPTGTPFQPPSRGSSETAPATTGTRASFAVPTVPASSTRHNSFSPQQTQATPRAAKTSNPTRNAFGQSPVVSKRPGSPLDTRLPKTPKLGLRGDIEDLKHALTEDLRAYKQELQAQFHAERDKLREDLHRDLTGLGEPLKTHLTANFRSDLHLVETELASKSEESGRAMQQQLGLLRATFETEAEKIESLRVELQQLKKDLMAKQGTDIAGLQEEIRSNADRLVPLQSSIEEGMQDLKSLLAKSQSKGYFVQVCQAPDGRTQEEYESRLFQACLCYISLWWGGDPASGGHIVYRDFSTLEETKKMFADLDEASIVSALEHFHQKVFRRHLTHAPNQGDGQEEELCEAGLDGDAS